MRGDGSRAPLAPPEPAPTAVPEAPVADRAAPASVDEPGVLGKVWAILAPAERRQLLALLPAVVVMALFETAGVASIVPFLGLLSDPAAIEKHALLRAWYQAGDFTSPNSFFFVVGLAVLLLVTVGNAISGATTWALLRFSWMGNHTLSLRLLGDYLRRPYEFFLAQNTADLSKNILSEVQSVVTGVLVQGVQLTARGCVVLFVVASLVVLDPVMAAGVAVAFGGVYGAIFLAVRRALTNMGTERVAMNQQRYRLAAEALAGVKELKLYGLEETVLAQYAQPSTTFATLQARHAVLAQLPKFALETIAFGGVLAMVLYLLGAGRSLTDSLPVLGLYAFAAYRMLPGLQVVFAGMTTIRFQLGALGVLYRDLDRTTDVPAPAREVPEVRFESALVLDDVRYHYASAPRSALDGVSLRLGRGEWLALVGATGAGKSTLVDVMLGLLPPTSGRLLVDGGELDDTRRRGWQRVVAYVPQQIFLADDTVARNIAFGLPSHAVDQERLRWAARVAQIDDFVTEQLPKGYDTPIGERGIRLSGGQRQRIGVARALYRRPKLLVLDEATSALDNETEARFFAALESELSETAVVSIAHRLTTTRGFDRILVLEHGRVVDEGSYDELAGRVEMFRMVRTEGAG